MHCMMKIRQQATDTLADVTDASKKIGETAEWIAVAMLAVTLVSVAALFLAVAARGASERRPA